MPVVTRIRTPGHLPGTRLVALDDGRRLYADAEQVAKSGLAPGEAVEAGLLQALVAYDAYLRARQRALRLLAARPRTAAELRARLRRLRVPEEQAGAVLRDLAGAGYLDDLSFARLWVQSRASRPRGVARLRWELREKGVSTELIERAIREASAEEDLVAAEERQARALVERRMHAYARLAPEARLRRIAGLLERRGFAASTIARVLRAVNRQAGYQVPGE
jgi:regulatory protein